MLNLSYTIFKTQWGYFGLCSTEIGLYRSSLPSETKNQAEKYLLSGLDNPVFKKSLLPDLQDKIAAYYKDDGVDFSQTPIDFSGCTPFSQRILKSCMRITYGETKTYKELAQLAGSPNAARAAGMVMSRNRTPLIIPCHRVLGADGSLHGFSAPGGIAAKKRMLTLESKEK
jgi:methylated-DNA-[protein]-cysteine S-methyltransferase